MVIAAFICFGWISATAQVKKKTADQPEKAPTQKELQDMMKEANGMMAEMMKDMSPEDRKMMDSMGIKMPDMNKAAKNIPQATDKQLAKAWENENRIVPAKDAARIAAIPKGLTDARMNTYIAAIQKGIMNGMSAEALKAGDKVYSFIQANSKNAREAGNIAAGFWISGKPEMALYLMGRVCERDPQQIDNISNFAAMLSMQGGQHLAIPLLNNLNSKFPKNSTVLNNLGQAWFGLGEIDKAGKYLDSTLALYPQHAQANLTKSKIQESKGDKKGAIECLKKSIKEAYTKDKDDKLRQLGEKLQSKDVKLPYPPHPDELGMAKMKRPDYPYSISQVNALMPHWQEYSAECEERIGLLQKELQKSGDQTAANAQKMAAEVMAQIGKGGVPSVVIEPIFAKRAGLEMNERKAFHEARIKKLSDATKQLTFDIEAIRKDHKNAAPEAPCEDHVRAINSRLKALNERKRLYDEQSLTFFREFYNEMAYYARFTSTDQNMYNTVVAAYKIGWLQKCAEYQPLDMSNTAGIFANCVEDEDAENDSIADFDDVGCKVRDTTNLIVWQFITTCTKLISKLNLKVIEYTRLENFERAEGDYYVESSLKLSVEKGFDGAVANRGPLKAEAKVGAAIQFEFDRSGVKDIVVSAEAKVGAGHNTLDKKMGEIGNLGGKDVWDTTLEIGVEAKTSLISGSGSIGGTGKLEGLTLVNW
jgi:tetratricopeptide (TPR) repeat protein